MAKRIGSDPVSFHTPPPAEGPRPAATTSTRLQPPGDRAEFSSPKLPTSLFERGGLDPKKSFIKFGSGGKLELTRNRTEGAKALDVFNSIKGALDHAPDDRSALPALMANMDALRDEQKKGLWNTIKSIFSPSYRDYLKQVDAAHEDLTTAIGSKIMQRAQLRMEGKELVAQSRADTTRRRTQRAEAKAAPVRTEVQSQQAPAQVPASSRREAPSLITKAEGAGRRADQAMSKLSSHSSVAQLKEAMESLQGINLQLRRLREAKLQAERKAMDPSIGQKLDQQISYLATKHQALADALSGLAKK